MNKIFFGGAVGKRNGLFDCFGTFCFLCLPDGNFKATHKRLVAFFFFLRASEGSARGFGYWHDSKVFVDCEYKLCELKYQIR